MQDVAVQVKVLRPGSTTASVEEDLEPSAAGILP